MWLILITHPSSSFSLFFLSFFLSWFLFVCFCVYVSSLSLPWYSRIWGPWAFRERWELDKGCVKRVFLELNRCGGYHSSWGFLVYGIAHSTRISQRNYIRLTFHLDTSAAIPPGYLSCHSTRPTSHFLWMSHSRHSTRISQCNHTRPTFHFLWMSHSRHSARIPQSPFHPADIPFSLDVSQQPFHPDTSAAIPPGCLSRHSTRPTSHFLWMSYSRHSIRPTFHLLRIFHTRLLTLDGRGGRFNFQLSLQIKMSF